MTTFDVITTGRIGVDLYPLQTGRSLGETAASASNASTRTTESWTRR